MANYRINRSDQAMLVANFISLTIIACLPLGKAQSYSLAASDEAPEISIPEGSQLTIYADHQRFGITSPTALTFNEKNEILVAETHRFMADRGIDDNRQRRYWILEDLAAQTTEDRMAMYERYYDRHPPEHYTTHAEKIRILRDTSGNHKADDSAIFADDFNHPLDGTAAGIFSFQGKNYFACIPNIWILEDTNGDGSADSREVMQDGFGVRVSFSGHDLNGFTIGPCGRIYGTIGDRGFSFTTREGREYSYPGQGAIFRFDPDGSNFEVIHTGLRNPKEIAFDQFGNGISVDNNADMGDKARIVYVVDGADSGWHMGHQVLHSFHRTAGLKIRPINPWMAEKMSEPANASQPSWLLPPLDNQTAGPSGLTFQPGTGYMGAGANRFFICDYRGGRANSLIWSFGLAAKGASYEVIDVQPFAKGTAATDVEFSFDGHLYVTDFMGGWSSHDNGRIFSIQDPEPDPRAAEVAKLIADGIHNLDSNDLHPLLSHPDQRIRLRAQIALAALPDAFEKFNQTSQQDTRNQLARLHATWGLWMLARQQDHAEATSRLTELTTDPDPEVRAQATRALGEAPLTDTIALLKAAEDDNPRVRKFAFLSLARHPKPSHRELFIQALGSADFDCPYLRHSITWALAETATADQLAALANHPTESVRLGAVIALRRQNSEQLSAFLADPSNKVRFEAIRSIHDQQILPAQANVAKLTDEFLTADKLELSPMLQQRLIHSCFRVGGTDNLTRLCRIANAPAWNPDRKLEALRLIKEWTTPFPVDQSLGRHAPLAERDVESYRKTLATALSPLLSSSGDTLARTLEIITEFNIEIDGLTPQLLAEFITNSDLPGEVRAQSLRSLANLSTEQLSPLLPDLIADSNDQVAIAALDELAKINPDAALNAASQLVTSTSTPTPRQQAAWTTIATIPSDQAAQTITKALEQLPSTEEKIMSSALELVRAAEARDEASVKTALEDYRRRAQQKDPLGDWMLSLSGGSSERGRRLFESHGSAQCMRCHSVGGGHNAAGDAGPNLAGIAARHDQRYLLESLILPDAEIAPGFGNLTLFFANGGFLSGTLEGENDSQLIVRSGADLWAVNRSDIQQQTGPNSSMPTVDGILDHHEVRDVVAYLATLDKESKQPSDTPQPTTFDPTEATKDPIALGSIIYQNVCASCHGENGQGLAPNPPLAGSEWLELDDTNFIRMQLHGLVGPIQVKGTNYEMMMPANGYLSDTEIAAVVSYVRSRWAPHQPEVSEQQVAEVRSEQRFEPWTADELLAATSESIRKKIKFPGLQTKVQTLPDPGKSPADSGGLGVPIWGILVVAFWLLVSIIGAGIYSRKN